MSRDLKISAVIICSIIVFLGVFAAIVVTH